MTGALDFQPPTDHPIPEPPPKKPTTHRPGTSPHDQLPEPRRWPNLAVVFVVVRRRRRTHGHAHTRTHIVTGTGPGAPHRQTPWCRATHQASRGAAPTAAPQATRAPPPHQATRPPPPPPPTAAPSARRPRHGRGLGSERWGRGGGCGAQTRAARAPRTAPPARQTRPRGERTSQTTPTRAVADSSTNSSSLVALNTPYSTTCAGGRVR